MTFAGRHAGVSLEVGDRRLQVALVVPSLTEGGGVPSVARFLCRVLELSDRYEPFLVSLAMSSRDVSSVRLLDPKTWSRHVLTREGTWDGRPFVHVGARLVEIEFMRYMPRGLLTQRLRKADVVQVVAGAPCWAFPVSTAGIPTCVHVATLTALERARRQLVETGPAALWRRTMTSVTRRLDRRAMKKCDRVFVMNRRLRDVARRICEPDRVILAPPGIDVEHFRPRENDLHGGESGYILSVARFSDPRKNVELLFRAYAKFRRGRHRAPELWLAGASPPCESAWKIAAQEGVASLIRYVGRVSDAELAELYRDARYFVLSSDEEGFGLVLAEAMASGIPVVSTACGGPDDIVTHGEDGFLVPVGSAEGLAEAMERLNDDPDVRARMGRRARKTAVECYSLEVAGRRFLQEYDAMLGRAGRRSPREGTPSPGDVPGAGLVV